jgi:outer membrane immunogenic protein
VKSLQIVLLGASFLAGAGFLSAANAADVYARGGSLKDTPVSYAPVLTWTGFYIGANAGVAFNNDDNNRRCRDREYGGDDPSAEGMSIDHCDEINDRDGRLRNNDGDDAVFVGGFHAGYNWQRDSNWVFGIEGDIDGVDSDIVNFLASIRGRLGWASGPSLFYLTGGVAFLGLDDDIFRDDTATGFVVGLGWDYKLRENWSVGLEGLYYNFEDNRDVFGFDENVDFWTVRARLTYHFSDHYAEPLK